MISNFFSKNSIQFILIIPLSDSKTQMQFRSCDIDTVEGKKYEHAVFLLLGKGKRKKKEKPPKMVAETEKGAEGEPSDILRCQRVRWSKNWFWKKNHRSWDLYSMKRP